MSGNVLAVLEERDGKLRKVSFEVVTAARRLGAKIDAVVCDVSNREGAAAALADRAKTAYRAVVFAGTATGKDLAPRVAARLGVPVAADLTDLVADGGGGGLVVTRPVYAGKALLKVKVTAQPAVLSLRPSVFTPDADAAAVTPERLAVTPGGRVTVREIKAAPAGTLDVAEAQVIISGGRGLKEPANFKVLEELAHAFGGRGIARRGRCRLASPFRSSRPDGQDGKPVALHRGRHFRCDSASRRHAHVEGDRRDQQGQRRADFQSRGLRSGG